jgi:hypothetical protein
MVDYTSTQARAKGVAPSSSREGSQDRTAAAEPLNASSPPTVDGVDMLYHCHHTTSGVCLLAPIRPNF